MPLRSGSSTWLATNPQHSDTKNISELIHCIFADTIDHDIAIHRVRYAVGPDGMEDSHVRDDIRHTYPGRYAQRPADQSGDCAAMACPRVDHAALLYRVKDRLAERQPSLQLELEVADILG